ncbi:hypothetical protein E3J38_09835 [candidate division TA06 bacterium]|uniref:Uncharacterized protein n=1 Tax=candidate division TA06 bacterium TaxID=2250710 RepID=A0A523XDZ8_UNCT6|nr:MAG: hypothetical protein E3J38_09835 [candidate division TA06 bacterium]
MTKKSKSSRRDTPKDIVLFTGQSGIKIERCLRKIKGERPDSEVEVIKLEEAMIERYKEKFPNSKDYDDRTIVDRVLALPPLAQGRLWEQSLSLVKKRLGSKASAKKLFLVSFHACFYHTRNREFLSPVGLTMLKTLANRTKLLIVLVDDCYDIYKRLLDEKEMFHKEVMHRDLNPHDAMVRSIWNLLTVLSWREIEIAFSRKLAEMLSVQFFIVPVKHPVFMIERLVFVPLDRLQIFYLAHPITSVRRRTYARGMRFPYDLNAFAERMLQEDDSVVIFIPDTIDELRIECEQDGYYTPELSQGWDPPFDESEWLFVSLPQEVMNLKPLNPKDFPYQSDEEAKRTLSYAIGILAQKIEQQITSRDYGLIEQSKNGIIVFQPYWEGDVSGGALREAEYNSTLRDDRELKQTNRKMYVLEKLENLGKYRISQIFGQLEGSALREALSDEGKERLHGLKKEWLESKERVEQFFEGKWSAPEIRCEIQRVLPSAYEFDKAFLSYAEPSIHGSAAYETGQVLDAAWKKLLGNVRSLDPFTDYCGNPFKEYFLDFSAEFGTQVDKLVEAICQTDRRGGEGRKR